MEQKIREIIAQMTLEEKAGLCSGKDTWHLKAVERLGVPSAMVSDGPHGLRKQVQQGDHLGINDSISAVCFPAACATASSFDEDLLHTMGSALGEECRAEGVFVLLGPAVNMKRSPLCGRNFEYFSEDPYLAGKLAAAQIRGVQEWDVGTSLKHFAANNQEYRRMTGSSELEERTLREIYLRGFEIAVKEAKPWTVMCSYNKINGTFASENKMLLNDILRNEWGFEGCVMSDWGAVNDRVKGLAAGMDLEMPGPSDDQDAKIAEAVRSGKLSESTLNAAVERILKTVFRSVGSQNEAVFDREKHHHLATDIEKECAVLLKNDGVLPLGRQQKVAFIGEFAVKPRYQGGGSSHINACRVDAAFSAALAKGADVVYAKGFSADRDETDEALFAEAVAAAKDAQAAVVFAGLPDSFESEGYDRSHMRLPDCQNELIERLLKVQKNLVIVLHNGSPVELPWADRVGTVLELYLGGQGVGEAADALLFGEANPCGRLAETFPRRLEENPSYLNFGGDGKTVKYAEGVYIGYRYYDAKKMEVRYPFGHGLSYTEFSYGNAHISDAVMKDGGSVTVSVDVTNTGRMAGKEVVQLYVRDCTGTPCRPEKELKGFAKILLNPGETKTVAFTVTPDALSWYNERLGDWYAAGGRYELMLAHSSRDIRAALPFDYVSEKQVPFTVDENTTIGDLLSDTRTAPVMKLLLGSLHGTVPTEQSDAAREAITLEMIRQMIDNAPIRALRRFVGLTQAQMNGMIAQMNGLIKAK